MNLRNFIVLLSALYFEIALSQDIHFSQFNASLLNLSPGFTGLFNGDYRVGAVYRSQWQSVPVNFSTFSISGEKRFRIRQLENDHLGVGILVNSDRAGDARYGSTQVFLSGTYIFLLKPDSSLMVTAGTNIGWCQVGFDYTKMTFDNQFDGNAFNRSIGSGESFGWQQKNFFDLNLGGAIRYIVERRHRFTYGVGVYHVTAPNISYQGDEVSRLDRKFSNYFSYLTPINSKNDIIAEALFNLQGKNNELIPHVSVKHHLSYEFEKAISGGVAYRSKDAVILRLGYFYKTLQSGISYDINISNFTPASNRRGGFEIFVNYIFSVKPSYVARKRYCPAFM